MHSKKWQYWGAQLFGWSAAVALPLIAADEVSDLDLFKGLGVLINGVLISHVFRHGILRFNLLRFSPLNLVPVVFLSPIFLALLFVVLQTFCGALIEGELIWSNFVQRTVGAAILFFFWSILYFGFHFFERSRESELSNVKLEASRQEAELQNLKMQMNPHFMFNSMNSIRALIDENPKLAKDAITKLSTLLRNTLITGKKQLISLKEEMQIVQDYLDLEKIRFEERLRYEIVIPENLEKESVPPLMIQTLVENGVKHGISNLAKGGDVIIKVSKTNVIVIEVLNSGSLNETDGKKESTGIGVENTIQRLEILYKGKAKFSLIEEDKMVRAKVSLPIN